MSAFRELLFIIVDELPTTGDDYTVYILEDTLVGYKWNGSAFAQWPTPTTPDLSPALLKANNLSDLTNTSTARTNLGLGTLATQNGTFSGSSSGTNTGDETTSSIGQLIDSSTDVGEPIDSDQFAGRRSGSLIKMTWANIKAALITWINSLAKSRGLIYMASVIGDQPSSGSWSLLQLNGFTIYRWTTGSGGSAKTAIARWNSYLGSDFGSWPTGSISIETRRSAVATSFVIQFLDNTGAQIGSNININPVALNTLETFVVSVPANAYWGVNKKFTMRVSITTTAASATFDIYLNSVEYKPTLL